MQQAGMQKTERAVIYKDLFVSLLDRRDTDVNLQDSSGRSALMVASVLGHFDVVSLLLRNKACDANLVSQNGDIAHSLAISSGNVRVVQLLEL
jgi:ankyrin repeat protein